MYLKPVEQTLYSATVPIQKGSLATIHTDTKIKKKIVPLLQK